VSTSTDSDIVLRDVTHDANGRLRAVVTFQSTQARGYGPKGSENETCTRWNITYILTQPDTGRYRIFASTNASHATC
jgi:hypothetical protein